MIPFNVPVKLNSEGKYFKELLKNNKFSGDGPFTIKCSEWFNEKLGSSCLLTTSCTHALEMAALLLEVGEGDEVIMPSYTFVSTANAFVLRGAKIIFVDIREDTLNIDENKIEQAVTSRTRVIVPVHYAGVACEMDKIMEIAKRHKLFVVEDAAQGMMSSYKGKALGTIGDIGTYSFHETKNYHCGEGGLLILNKDTFKQRAEIIREKGTNRSQFFKGLVDKYTWVDIGSSYLPSELNAMFLYPQLLNANKINEKRLRLWDLYFKLLEPLSNNGDLELPTRQETYFHNGHMFYIKLKDICQRDSLIEFLKEKEISSVFHYVPLHSTPYGKKVGIFHGDDINTTKESERLLRLPLFYDLELKKVKFIVNVIKDFF